MPSTFNRGLLLALGLVMIGLAATSPAAIVSAGPSTFSFNWNGGPATAQPWRPGLINDWDLIVHNRDNQNSLQMVNAEHGADCAPFPATHPVTQFQDAVFICNNHMMTALNGGGYSEIVMTPAQLLDFSVGGSVQVSASTAKLNNRDWIDFWISPFQENLLLPSGGIPPDLQGPTKDALLVNIDSSIPTTAHVQEFKNYVSTDFPGTGRDIESCVASLGGVSASRRDPLQLSLTRTHVRLDLNVKGSPCTLVDTDINDLGFALGVVQLGHHSYSPDEATACNLPGCSVNTGAGAGNTWHWSNFSMSPAVPFTMLRGDIPLTGVQANTSPTVQFAGAAPANSFLRFSALARRGSIQISANGGAFFPGREQMQKGDGVDGVNDASHIGYWTPIPAGTTSVTLKTQDSTQPWQISDVSIWSSSAASITSVQPTTNPGGGTTGGGTGSGTGSGTSSGGGSTAGSVDEPAGGGSTGGSTGEPGSSSTGGSSTEPGSNPGSDQPGGPPASETGSTAGGADGVPAAGSAPNSHGNVPVEIAAAVIAPKSIRAYAAWLLVAIVLVGLVIAGVRLARHQARTRPGK